jgi:hypothetical protein
VGIRDPTETVYAGGRAAFVLKELKEGEICDTSTTRLLGHVDASLLGCRRRPPAVPDTLATRVPAGGGFVLPVVLHDGQMAGTWRSRVKGDVLRVELEVGRKISAEIGNEVVDLGRFLGMRTSIGRGRARVSVAMSS